MHKGLDFFWPQVGPSVLHTARVFTLLLNGYSAGTYTPRRRTVAMGGWTTIMKAVIPACEL
jgi:hypothetical protein